MNMSNLTLIKLPNGWHRQLLLLSFNNIGGRQPGQASAPVPGTIQLNYSTQFARGLSQTGSGTSPTFPQAARVSYQSALGVRRAWFNNIYLTANCAGNTNYYSSRAGANSTMSAQAYFVGVDVGTGSARAALVNAKGQVEQQAVEAIKTWTPEPHFYEQSSEDIWYAICKVVKVKLAYNLDIY